MSSDQTEFRDRLLPHLGSYGDEAVAKVVHFRALLCEESQRQNLTKLLSPEDFLFGHVIDAIELEKSRFVLSPALDLGSGGGVPGILMAIFGGQEWVLTESERRKAEFLQRVVDELGLSNCRVFAGRAEDYLKDQTAIHTVVARAVGPVDRIFGWIRNCSTWNRLVLLKGPGWNEEWRRFSEGKTGKHLLVRALHEYRVGPEEKHRVIIHLERAGR